MTPSRLPSVEPTAACVISVPSVVNPRPGCQHVAGPPGARHAIARRARHDAQRALRRTATRFLLRPLIEVRDNPEMSTPAWPGKPYPLGATYDGHGVNFALFSEAATRVELCLFASATDRVEHTRIELTEITSH